MDTGTRILIVVLVLAALVIVDMSWYYGYYSGQVGHWILRLLSGFR